MILSFVIIVKTLIMHYNFIVIEITIDQFLRNISYTFFYNKMNNYCD